MARKIMILCGSPRTKGNTNTLAGWFAEGATEAGADVEIVDAANLEYKSNGCTACGSCQKSEKFGCVIEDEASDVLLRVGQADVVVFATPVYFFGVTAQLKLLMDRMHSLIKFNPADKSVRRPNCDQNYAVLATAGGDMNGGLGLVGQTFETLAGFTGAKVEKLLVPHAPQDPGETAKNTDLKNKARQFGTKLAQA